MGSRPADPEWKSRGVWADRFDARLQVLERIVGEVLVDHRIERDAAARNQADGVSVRGRILAGVHHDGGQCHC